MRESRESLVISVVIGLFLAALIYIVGTSVTDFRNEGTIWGLLAVLIFLVAVFRDRVGGRRA